jgi:hypothetical protein
VGNPEGVIQALREQSVMSIPIRAPLWISAGGNYLHSEEIDQQQGRVTFRAVTTQTDGAAKGVFARRVGPGAPCPHCDKAVAIVDRTIRAGALADW